MSDFLQYIEDLNTAGVQISKRTAEIEIFSPMGVNKHVLSIDQLKVTSTPQYRWDEEAEQEAIKWAIDFDKWQQSWHTEIKPGNYAYFLEIIQGRVIEKAEALVKLNAIAVWLQNKILTDNIHPEVDNKKYDDCEPF